MSFSQSSIRDVKILRDGAELYVVWSSSALGKVFQVYIDRRLAWYGLQTFCCVPIPLDANGRNVWIEVGTVTADDKTKDYSGSLNGPGGNGNRAQLTWYGGSYLDAAGLDDIQGYYIFSSASAGGAVDYSKPIDSIPAYPSGILTDGYGMGAFGLGGFGRGASFYEWRSAPLSSGTWVFAVAPYDKEGNSQESPLLARVTIGTAPLPPRVGEHGGRLTYDYSSTTTRIATLNWLASLS
jgi:hypothetical protein